MRLSKLQKFIILKCFENKGGGEQKTEFYKYYSAKKAKEKRVAIQVAIQNSIDSLVEKDLIVAYGHKTAKKWTVNRVKLTSKGKKLARELILSNQKKLPIK